MSTLPELCSGAVVQVPLRREELSATKRIEYWGGGIQLLTTRRRAGAAWLLRYTGLEAKGKLPACCSSARPEQRMASMLNSPIPSTGTVYAQCEIDFQSIQIVSERKPGYEVRFRLHSASE